MGTLRTIKRALRGEVKLTTAALEAVRRTRASFTIRHERAHLDEEHTLNLCSPDRTAKFFSIESSEVPQIPTFSQPIEWNRDPRSGYLWPLDYHRDISLFRSDGSDIRLVWELNRLGHFLTLARAYKATNDERYVTEFLDQLKSWTEHNPYGRGPNWTCAMEVALRAVNLIAARELFRESPQLDTQFLLTLFQQHGNYIRRNLEFSYIATSNHYRSDVAGLLWLGVMVPELRDATRWRDFGLKELLREMDKQVLADGADCEASTGYHRFVTELFLYSFILARENGIEIDDRRLRRLGSMLEYLRAYQRPDGRAPLVGDTDGGQFLPVPPRDADEHAYLLAVGASFFGEPRFRLAGATPVEVWWMTGAGGVRGYEALAAAAADGEPGSRAFEEAGTYVLREGDLFMLFNASGAGLAGRGSHGHNDALAVEVSARGACF